MLYVIQLRKEKNVCTYSDSKLIRLVRDNFCENALMIMSIMLVRVLLIFDTLKYADINKKYENYG